MSLEELIRRKHGKVIAKKIPFSQEVKRSIYLLIITLLALIVLLGIVFLMNTSQSTQKGYVVQKEQFDKDKFLLRNRELINKIIEAQSFKTIQDNEIVKGMQKPDSVTYLQGKNSIEVKNDVSSKDNLTGN